MKNCVRLLSAFLLITAITFNAYAENNTSGSSGGEFVKVGAAGAQFLKIGPGARANAMAGCYNTFSDDITAVYWNPAGLAEIRGMSASFGYTSWFANFAQMFGAASMPVGENFTAAIGLYSFGCDDIEITTTNKPEGTGIKYSVNDICVSLSFAGKLTDQFTFGVNAKYVNNSFAAVSANAFAFDIGTIYNTGIQGIKIGFSIHNLGTETAYSGQDLRVTNKLVDALNMAPQDAELVSNSFSIPLIFRAGASMDILKTDEHKVVAAADFTTHSDVPEQYSFGAEYVWNGLLAVRGGYKFGQEQLGVSGGIGLQYLLGNALASFDYSINPTKDLGLIHRLTLNVGLK